MAPPTDDTSSADRSASPYPYDSEGFDLWGWGRVVVGYGLTLGALGLGLGYCLVYSALEGRYPPVAVLAWFIPAIMGVMALTWRVGNRPAIQPWMSLTALAIVIGWFAMTFVLGMRMTTARDSHWMILAMYAAATLWMPWLAWMGSTAGGWFSKVSVLVVLVALIFGFHYLVEVPGLTGDRQVQLAMRKKKMGLLVVGDTPKTTAVLLDPTPYDFPQYLGPNRNATFVGIELERDWKKAPPELKWRHAIGKGWGSFAIVGDFGFTQEQRDDDECVVCYWLRTGEVVWIHTDRDAFRSTFGGDGPRATPAVRDGMVYTVGATGIVNCLAGDTGQVIWTTRIRKEEDANLPHGVCGSPLLMGDLLWVCPVTSAERSIVALDVRTGKEVLAGKSSARAAYSSPVDVEIGGVRQILAFHSQGVAAHDAKTAATLWEHPWGNNQGVNASQPIVFRDNGDNVFLSTSYGTGSTLVQVTHKPDGSWSAQQRWKTPKFKNQFSTSVVVDGTTAVGLDDGILAAIDLKSGKVVWKEGRFGHGQILQVGSVIVVLSETGDLFLVDPRASKKEIAHLPEAISGKTWNHLAISPPYLLVRNAQEAACYKLAVADESSSAAPVPKTPVPPGDTQAKTSSPPKVQPAGLPNPPAEAPAEKKPPAPKATSPRPSAFDTDLALPTESSSKPKSPSSPADPLAPLPPPTGTQPSAPPIEPDPFGGLPPLEAPPTGSKP